MSTKGFFNLVIKGITRTSSRKLKVDYFKLAVRHTLTIREIS